MSGERQLRLIILTQILLFILGASAHAGFLPVSYPHIQARTAESVIALILTLGLTATFAKEAWGHRVVIMSQVLSLIGTLIGLTMILIGAGPRSAFDFILHGAMLVSFVAVLSILLRPFRFRVRKAT